MLVSFKTLLLFIKTHCPLCDLLENADRGPGDVVAWSARDGMRVPFSF